MSELKFTANGQLNLKCIYLDITNLEEEAMAIAYGEAIEALKKTGSLSEADIKQAINITHSVNSLFAKEPIQLDSFELVAGEMMTPDMFRLVLKEIEGKTYGELENFIQGSHFYNPKSENHSLINLTEIRALEGSNPNERNPHMRGRRIKEFYLEEYSQAYGSELNLYSQALAPEIEMKLLPLLPPRAAPQ